MTLSDIRLYGYAARWLPVRNALEQSGIDVVTASKQQQDIQDQLWGKARQYSLASLTRPSYRSILALFLFTLTERPVDYDEPGLTYLCTQSHVRTLCPPQIFTGKCL